MKIPIQANISYVSAGLTVLLILLLTVFCQVVDFSLIIPLIFLFIGLHLFFVKKAKIKLFLHLGLLVTLLIFSIHAFNEYFKIPFLALPVSYFAILTMLLFDDLQLAFLMSLVSSVLVGLLMRSNPVLSRLDVTLIYFIGNLTSVYTVREARTRGKLLEAGIFAGIMHVLSLILLHPELMNTMMRGTFLYVIRPLTLSGLLAAVLVLGTLKIFEYLFGVLTTYSLTELSDFNQPIMKRMILEAPGTYHHSLVVSNIAEAAADTIGANALLTRVGAYYHDIGKLEKPEYYTENQMVGGNKHDDIEPSISRLVILNHVKEGIELGRRYKLNPIILDFIPQHHGTSLMYYFYQKALEEAQSADTVKEENYRYPGPKPQTKEAAIVLLADSVEAATRSLDDPTPPRVAETVRKIINNKFIDGQLDDCNLTLKEIEMIAETFTRILGAMYHSRIKYPEKKNGNNGTAAK
jgi:cyclic-di-AMP phosphodiesterase PgpH